MPGSGLTDEEQCRLAVVRLAYHADRASRSAWHCLLLALWVGSGAVPLMLVYGADLWQSPDPARWLQRALVLINLLGALVLVWQAVVTWLEVRRARRVVAAFWRLTRQGV